MNVDAVRGSIKRFGALRTVADLALHSVNRVILLRILKAILIQTVDTDFLECDEKYRGMFLDEPTLRGFAADPRNEIPPTFLDEALPKGDECYGFLAGDRLAAYGWYSTRPTTLDFPGLRLRFDSHYVYMYKGFTAAEHRGQRLHAVGMTRALAAYLARGYSGIVSYVEWNNFASLKSCYRMGYRAFGTVIIAGLRTHYALWHDAGSRKYGFRVERASGPDDGAAPEERMTRRSSGS
jgi:hypothetical protein